MKLKYLLLAALMVGCGEYKCVDKVVAEVGGCDKYGDCGTLFTDGTSKMTRMPIKGAAMQVCYHVEKDQP